MILIVVNMACIQRFLQCNQCSLIHKQGTFTVQEELNLSETVRAVAELTLARYWGEMCPVRDLDRFEVHPSIYFLLQLVLVYRCSLILGTLHLFHVSICLALDLHLLAW